LSVRNKIFFLLVSVLIIGFLIPQNLRIPVKGALKADYHPESFWYYPWGRSVTHKGIDVFARKGTKINSATSGVVLYSGKIPKGGKVVLVLGPKWRLHYYAHLDKINSRSLSIATKNTTIGTVGATGNAAGKPSHLHYSIITPIPYVWKIDGDRQGWKKMFYLNTIEYF